MSMVRQLLAKLPDVNRTGQSAGADIGLWIEADGGISECHTRRAVGDQALASQFCEALVGFVVDRPVASMGDNVPAYTELTLTAFPDQKAYLRAQLIRQLVELRIGSPEELLLQPLLAGRSKGKALPLLVEVDAEGKIGACTRGSKKLSESVTAEACSTLLGRSVVDLKYAEDRPVRHVRTFGTLTN